MEKLRPVLLQALERAGLFSTKSNHLLYPAARPWPSPGPVKSVLASALPFLPTLISAIPTPWPYRGGAKAPVLCIGRGAVRVEVVHSPERANLEANSVKAPGWHLHSREASRTRLLPTHPPRGSNQPWSRPGHLTFEGSHY